MLVGDLGAPFANGYGLVLNQLEWPVGPTSCHRVVASGLEMRLCHVFVEQKCEPEAIESLAAVFAQA